MTSTVESATTIPTAVPTVWESNNIKYRIRFGHAMFQCASTVIDRTFPTVFYGHLSPMQWNEFCDRIDDVCRRPFHRKWFHSHHLIVWEAFTSLFFLFMESLPLAHRFVIFALQFGLLPAFIWWLYSNENKEIKQICLDMNSQHPNLQFHYQRMSYERYKLHLSIQNVKDDEKGDTIVRPSFPTTMIYIEASEHQMNEQLPNHLMDHISPTVWKDFVAQIHKLQWNELRDVWEYFFFLTARGSVKFMNIRDPMRTFVSLLVFMVLWVLQLVYRNHERIRNSQKIHSFCEELNQSHLWDRNMSISFQEGTILFADVGHFCISAHEVNRPLVGPGTTRPSGC